MTWKRMWLTVVVDVIVAQDNIHIVSVLVLDVEVGQTRAVVDELSLDTRC
jgi:hypothetical protein